jgi:hypothetical protein
VMAAQLQHLLSEAESPHVMVQVVPFSKGLPAGSSLFIVLTQQEGPAMLYTETMHHGHVDDSVAAVAEAQAKYDRLRAAAMAPDESLTFIHDVMREYAR